MAKIEHVVLTKPDTPPETFADRLTGTVRWFEFATSTFCELKEHKDERSKAKSPRRVTALITTDELIDDVWAIAKARQIATFSLRLHTSHGNESCIEILSVETCARDLAPLGPAEA